ncbi:hypothetical protein D5086_005204 [Populus alba]|uniref:Uncharacterized protein n=1 Tax=Populus alba TaxID=43335 RepID=A0ACC4CSL6_POPAL
MVEVIGSYRYEEEMISSEFDNERVKERLVVFFCFRKGEVVVDDVVDGDKEELLVKALLGVVADGVKADGNYNFSGSW